MALLNVVHICTSVNGGAGTAAYRIHESLLESGINSSFLSIDKPKKSGAKACYQIEKAQPSTFRRWLNRFVALIPLSDIVVKNNRKRIKKQLNSLYPLLECELASLPFSEIDVLEHHLVKSADIIHLHWIAGILDYPRFFKNNNKPVVWTFHDMNPILGLFHYQGDEIRNRELSANLNEEILNIKKNAIKKRACSLYFVAPSVWLFEKAKASPLLEQSDGQLIAYPLDTEIFIPKNASAFRKELNVPESHTIFLFVAEHVNNYRKGMDMLLEALSALKEPITLLAIGESTGFELAGINLIMCGKISDDHLLSKYYSLADAIIIPSREDNLPNVMLEAMSCGTPVLSFNLGGMATVIKEQLNGLKATETNAKELSNTIRLFVAQKKHFDSSAIRHFTLKHFTKEIIARKYKALYNELLN